MRRVIKEGLAVKPCPDRAAAVQPQQPVDA